MSLGGMDVGGGVGVLPALTNGVAAGIMLSTVIGIVPMMTAQTYGRYVRIVQFLWPHYDPTMPILNGLSLLLDLVMCAVQPASARPFYATAAVLLAAVMTISITRNVPVNKFVFALDPQTEPENWSELDPRRRWRRWNKIRTGLAVTAFACNVLAIAAAAT